MKNILLALTLIIVFVAGGLTVNQYLQPAEAHNYKSAVISKDSTGSTFNWAMMAGVFFFLIIFWVAVWILDFKYYNRLLLGTVDALLETEELSKTSIHVKELSLSHKIEGAVAGVGSKKDNELHKQLSFGRKWFYGIVFFGLLVGLIFSTYKLLCS